ncbi:hypothetical protein ACFSHQ_16200 [Gemmobacter lanyuensis]
MWDAAGWEQWKADRLAALTAADGWLNLTDRLPMEPGRWTVGRAAENDLVLSVGPDHLGVLELRADLGASLSDPTGCRILRPNPIPRRGFASQGCCLKSILSKARPRCGCG